jgi:hypothetical protein
MQMKVSDQNAMLIFDPPLNRRFLLTKATHTKTLLYTKWPPFHALSDAVLEINLNMSMGSYTDIPIFWITRIKQRVSKNEKKTFSFQFFNKIQVNVLSQEHKRVLN